MSASRTLRRPADLVEAGLVPPDRVPALERVAAQYAVSITPVLAELMASNDVDHVIANQFLPDPAELKATEGERADPIGDDPYQVAPGLVHRYPDRALLKLANICAVYCRFCFRREMVGPGQPAQLSEADLDAAITYIAAHPELWEIIVSGGDPLVLSPRRLMSITKRLAAIPHVKVLRWHSRVPLVAPERIDAGMVDALKGAGATTWLALHANHPDEFTDAGRAAIAKLVDAGIPMVSQTVLLNGVNDDPETLAALMRAFVENRVKPYYLHHGDLAPGTSHFRTTIAAGRSLARDLRRQASGLCQPTYVLDLPGGYGKVPLASCHAHAADEGWLIEDARGVVHRYPHD